MFRSPKYGHLGVYFLCTGPDPNGPRPGERVRAVSARCKPIVQALPLVDIGVDGAENVLLADYQPAMGREVFSRVFGEWAARHGVQGGVSP